jgi:hypothetical protein
MGLLRVGMDTLFQQGKKSTVSLKDRLDRVLKK